MTYGLCHQWNREACRNGIPSFSGYKWRKIVPRHADTVVSMLPTPERMISRDVDPSKFRYVPNGIFPDDWQGETQPITGDLADHIKTISARGYLLVVYAGSHGLTDALYTLLEAAVLLKDQPIRFVLVGDVHEKRAIAIPCAEKMIFTM